MSEEVRKVENRKFWRLVLLAPCLVLFPTFAFAQFPPLKVPPLQVPSNSNVCAVGRSCAELAPAMIRSALSPSPLEENLRYLTDLVGERLSGTPAADHAVSWAVKAFRYAGVDEVHTEKFTIPAGWHEGSTQAEMVFPAEYPLHLVSTGWSPPTQAEGITADVVDVGFGDDAGFTKVGVSAKGAIVLVHSGVLLAAADISNASMAAPGIAGRAVNAGAAAIFWMSPHPNVLLSRRTLTVTGEIGPIPQAVVAREDAERIARFLSSGQKVRVRFEMPNHVSGPIESENVVAEIRGRETPDQFVLLGAHLDSWDLGTGALDDGCNAALVIDAARVIHASGTAPRRSVRFVLFTGEEQGMLGSWAYVRAHRSELDRLVAAVIFDQGTGRVSGYSLGGREDTLAAVREALDPVRSLGVKDLTLDAALRTDNFDFLLEGVPTLLAIQEPANYIPNYHAASDTFDKVDIGALKNNVAVAAITSYALADREERIGPRQSRSATEQLMKETGLDRQMKLEGFWSLWERGERGRNP